MYPTWPSSVGIPVFALLGIGGWLFGRTRGFMIIIGMTLYHFLLWNVLYGDILVLYQATALGPVLLISIVWLSGTLRENQEAIKETNRTLDQLVHSRNAELNAVTAVLLDRTEKMRIEIGEELHNGIGQEMTGIQLYCSSLAEQMVKEHNPTASLALSLRARAQQTHELVRWAARTLFPVKIGEMGLLSALHELASCLEESKQVKFFITDDHGPLDIPDNTALQLYRICQETALYILNRSDASCINIELVELPAEYKLIISHNSESLEFKRHKDVDAQLIEYRLNKVSGTMTVDTHQRYTKKFTVSLSREH
jgi:glucose-6-phosphate-specific signal transduction histidine kinase